MHGGSVVVLTGQATSRFGLPKVGIPGATVRPQTRDATIAECCSSRLATRRATRNEFLPTVHGFDEFYGNLYHLNAEEEQRTYPRDPAFHAAVGPRGVLRCKASDRNDPTVDPRFGKIVKQTIEETGPLMKKRMETIDDETSASWIDYVQTGA